MNKKIVVYIAVVLVAAAAFAAFNIFRQENNMGNEQRSFTASVLENMGTSILVQPEQGQDELNSSDKIVIRVPEDSAVLKDLSEFAEGSRVKITYGGAIMESYPAQINASKVERIQ